MNMDFFGRRRFLSALGAATAATVLERHAAAQSAFPSKPITLVVPFAAGGPTDAGARVVGKAMGDALGQPVVVENRPGAGGVLGSTMVAAGPADGHLLLWGGTSSLAVAPALFQNVKFDPEKSFIPIGIGTRGSLMLVGSNAFPPDSAHALVALGRERSINMGNGGNGTLAHLAAEQFREVTRVKMAHVAYRGGSPALTDLLAGVIDTAFDLTTFLAPHVKAGKLKAYAVTGRQRHKDFPEVPTVSELFGSDYEVHAWFGMFAPAQTPPAAVARLSAAMAQALTNSEVQRGLVAAGLEPAAIPGPEAAKIVSADYRKWTGVIARANVKVE